MGNTLKGPSYMARKIIVLIDGGFLRVKSQQVGKQYNPTFIANFADKCKIPGEEILRVLYYDCAPFTGTAASTPVRS